VWRLFGGFEGLQANLGMSRSTIYRRISAFRAVFGEHPDLFEFPGVKVDVEAFVRFYADRTITNQAGDE
jgi:predicted DNA-binding transcriptional regulator AlpA